jgi:predicted ATP-dependent Lon-type protease
MEKVKEWCEKMAKLEIFDPNQSWLTKEELKDKIVIFGKMLGMFDSIFAQVWEVEAGLLTTEEQIETLV